MDNKTFTVRYYFKQIVKRVASSVLNKYFVWLPDVLYLRIKFYLNMGYFLSLNNPKTYSEKIQWLKLYNRRPEYTSLVDKLEVKKYVTNTIGDQYVIPTLGVWDKPEDIDWEILPSQFVLKTTHGGGSMGVIICDDKNSFNIKEAIRKLNISLNQDIYKYCREFPYKNVVRRIIAEEYVNPDSSINDLPDYKFFCFNGKVKALFVGTERQKKGEEVKFDFFDADYNHLPFRQGHENAAHTPQKPKNFELMKEIAARLSAGIPHVRVDLYDVGDKVLFGELTFYHFSGMMPFQPPKWDILFGEMLTLPEKYKQK